MNKVQKTNRAKQEIFAEIRKNKFAVAVFANFSSKTSKS